jgi:DNA-binding transcriptional ArsR family regulator
MRELDPTIHQPARLRILMLLSGTESTDFTFVQQTLGLSKGNLSTHMARLEEKGYVTVTKSFRGRMPHTSYQLTKQGRISLAAYWEAIDAIRNEG